MSVPDVGGTARRRVRRERSATESLLSITLLLEAILIFFVVMVAFGLQVLPVGVVFGGERCSSCYCFSPAGSREVPWECGWAGGCRSRSSPSASCCL